MIEVIIFICLIVITGLGLFMFFMPEKSVKAEFKENKEQIQKTKRNGMILAILGLIVLLLNLFI